MADKVLEKLVVEIRTDQKKLNREMTQLKGGMQKQGEKLGKSFTTGFGNMLKGFGATFIATKVIGLVKESIQLYLQQEAAEKRLSVAYGKNIDNLKEYASALQAQTAYGDEAIIEAQALIAAFVKDEEAIKRATKATLDLAAAKGMDLKVAADLLSKTLGSSTNALSRYGIEVTGAVGSAERLDSAMKNLNEKFGGQAQAQLETYTGKLQAMSNAWGDMLEVVGKGAIESIFAGVQTLFSGGGAVGFANNLMVNQTREQFAKLAKEIEDKYKKDVPEAVKTTIVTIDSLEAEIKSLEEQLKTTNINDLVSRDRLQKLINGKQQIIDKFLNPIKKEIYKTFGEIGVKDFHTFDVDAFKNTDISKPVGGVDQWYVDLYQSKGKPMLEEQKTLWADINQAQSVAMGGLIANWTSVIKLFDKANSMLQQFLNTLVQIGIQQAALSIVDFIGGGIGSVFSEIGSGLGLSKSAPQLNTSLSQINNSIGAMNQNLLNKQGNVIVINNADNVKTKLLKESELNSKLAKRNYDI